MWQELLLSLLGFQGDLIVEDKSSQCFRVKDGYSLFENAEKEQLDRIVPLGWFYLRLTEYADKFDVKVGFGCQKGKMGLQVYKCALSQAIRDLLQEYVEDVVYIEQLIVSDGPLPLSHILQHFQKVYTLISLIMFTIILVLTSVSFPS